MTNLRLVYGIFNRPVKGGCRHWLVFNFIHSVDLLGNQRRFIQCAINFVVAAVIHSLQDIFEMPEIAFAGVNSGRELCGFCRA